ncbi:MAG: hypothetical protein RLZZ414_971 [Bacteroidota bacterium]|jgi:SNF2 family DNA or RNA helicase
MLDFDILLLKAQKELKKIPDYLVSYTQKTLNANSVTHTQLEISNEIFYNFKFNIIGGDKINLEIQLSYSNVKISTNCYDYNTNKPSKWVALALKRVVNELQKKVLKKSPETIKLENEKTQNIQSLSNIQSTNEWKTLHYKRNFEREYQIYKDKDCSAINWEIPNLKMVKFTVNDFKTNKNYTVEIKIEEENRPQLKCSCNQKIEGLCNHQKNAWLKFKNEIPPYNYFNDFISYHKYQIDDLRRKFKFSPDIDVLVNVKPILQNYFIQYDYSKQYKSNPKIAIVPFLNTLQKQNDELIKKFIQQKEKFTEVKTDEIYIFGAYNENLELVIGNAEWKKNGLEYKKNIPVYTNIKQHNNFAEFEFFSPSNLRVYISNTEILHENFNQYHQAIEYLKNQILFLNHYRLDTYLVNFNVSLDALTSIKIHPTDTAVLSMQINKLDNTFVAQLKVKINDELYDYKPLKTKYWDESNVLQLGFFHQNILYPWKNAYDWKNAKLLTEEDYEYSNDDLESYFFDFIEPISQNIEIIFSNPKDVNLKMITNPKVKKQLYLKSLDKHVLFVPKVAYNGMVIEIGNTKDIYFYEKKELLKIERDTELEKGIMQFLKDSHPKFNNQGNLFFMYLSPNEMIENLWFLDFFENCKKNEIEVFGFDTLDNFKYNTNKPKISSSIKSGIDWFDVELSLEYGNQKINLNELKKVLQKNERFIKLNDGTLGILPEEWIQKLQRYFRYGEIKKDEIKIPKLKFNIVEDLFEELNELEILQEIRAKKQKLLQYEQTSTVTLPKNIKAQLRPYQKSAFQWFYFLQETGMGGCLADDMGLGKTLQVITLLQKEKELKKKTSLVVLPKSLLFNWVAELEKFAPQLTYFVHHGNSRLIDIKDFKSYDLILTTYGTLTSDIELIRKFKFNYGILDESQAIKNPLSIRFKSVCLIQAQYRLVLTGTPIENNTFDLFAQMQFINPGLLGTNTSFKKEYSDAIDVQGDKKIADELQRLIHPFLLRRTKKQVAKELPEKTESILYCEMEDAQKQFYEKHTLAYKASIEILINQEGIGKSKFMVLEALTKLRQICNSPFLVDATYENSAVKIETLRRHILEKTGKHKVLVFSQFVGMLKLIEQDLQQHKIKTVYLDGSTNNRGDLVNEFQTNDEIRVFLISLKAGGTGLNLTAADYVYLVDPWWNPAVENQAIDRCYRIGQDKHVFAYRLICKGTIEEKILTLQSKKLDLADDLIKTDEAIMKKLNTKDIAELFG